MAPSTGSQTTMGFKLVLHFRQCGLRLSFGSTRSRCWTNGLGLHYPLEKIISFFHTKNVQISNLVYGTLSRARQLPQLFKFLLAWFIYSDGFSTIVAVAILFAKNLGASTPLLLLCGILAPLAAGVGSVVWPWIQVKIGWKTRHILILHALLYTALPLYGILFFNNVIEVIPLSIYHGFLLGATQSSCRVLFSELMPPGLESEFFGLYEITDKGSAWIGPLVIGLIRSATGNLRNGFYFLGAFLLIPAIVFYSIDEHKGKKDGLKFIAQNSAIPMTNLDGK